MTPQTIRTEKLLEWATRFGSIGRVEREWELFTRENDPSSFVPLPVHGTRYLYRGQTRRYSPLFPSIGRGVGTAPRSLTALSPAALARVLVALIRADWYSALIANHPVIAWASSASLVIDRMALAQHYGIPTGYLDVTESIEVALVFASCRLHADGTWQPCDEGRGILYRIDWDSLGPVRHRTRPIGLQPFPRPHEQWAWTLSMELGDDFELLPGVEAVEFQHSAAFGQEMLRRVGGGAHLFPPDPLADWAHAVNQSQTLPSSSASFIFQDIAQDALGLPDCSEDALRDLIGRECGVAISEATREICDPATIERLQTWWQRERPVFEQSLGSAHFRLFREPKQHAQQ